MRASDTKRRSTNNHHVSVYLQHAGLVPSQSELDGHTWRYLWLPSSCHVTLLISNLRSAHMTNNRGKRPLMLSFSEMLVNFFFLLFFSLTLQLLLMLCLDFGCSRISTVCPKSRPGWTTSSSTLISSKAQLSPKPSQRWASCEFSSTVFFACFCIPSTSNGGSIRPPSSSPLSCFSSTCFKCPILPCTNSTASSRPPSTTSL